MRQTAQRFVPAARGALEYLLYLPAGVDKPADRRWPLLLFLHGAGERGSDLELLLLHGLPKLIEEGHDFPFVVVSPQCPKGSVWYRLLPSLEGLLDEVSARLSIDLDQVFLTGLSMGGYGCWHLAARCPERFAAVVPICGGGLRSYGFPARVRALRELAVWAFHGEQDEVVKPEESIRLVDELRACGGQVTLTLYPGVAHDSWTETYASPELYRWLLAQRRQPRPSSPPRAPRRSTKRSSSRV